jgi:CDP-diacylglycerol--serine O-phosphatidyltransferase
VAATVYGFGAEPIRSWPFAVAWLALLCLLGFLMVSTWRYYSLKGFSLRQPRTPLIIILIGGLVYAIWNYGQIVLPVMAYYYVGSGIAIRAGGAIRRRMKHAPTPPPAPEHQLG